MLTVIWTVVPAEAERAVGVLEPAATEAPVGVADAAASAGAAVESATAVRAPGWV